MIVVWVALAFVAGWMLNHWLGRTALRALGSQRKWADDVLRGMSHDALLRLSAATQDELARWKKTPLVTDEPKPGFRVIVCGSRRWNDRERIADRLFDLPGNAVVVHGDAKGADRIAHQEAQKLGLLVEPHPADWERYGSKAAGPIRNREMANLGADLCIAFWDGRSRGTANMIEQAVRKFIPVEVVEP